MNPYHEKYLNFYSIDKHSPIFLCPLFAYVVLKKIINLKHKGLFDEFEYYLGKEYAKILCNIQIESRLSGVDGLKAAFLEFENFGFGKTKIVVLNKNRIILKNLTTSIARQYSKSFFEDKIKVDNFLSGVYSGILSTYHNTNIEIRESKCYAQGSQECFFENTDKVPNNYKLGNIIQNVLRHHRLVGVNEINYMNLFGEKLFQRGNYYKKNGIIKIINIYHVFFRFCFFTFSSYIMSKVHKDIEYLYRYLGYVQVNIAANFQRNQFGRGDSNKIFIELIGNINLFGYGIAKVISKKENEIVIKFSHMLLLRQCIGFMKTFQDPYFEGVLVGIPTGNKQHLSRIQVTKSKEDELIVNLLFGVKENLVNKLSKKIKSKRIKEIIQERMKHKYYLSPS